MLPTRLFRNTCISPALRSLVSPHLSLVPTIPAQLRLRMGALPGSYARLNSSTPASSSSSDFASLPSSSNSPLPNSENQASILMQEQQSSSTTTANESRTVTGKEAEQTVTSQQLPGRIDPRLSITFTCTVPDCNDRSTHEFSKRSYERGIVLVQCPKCKNRHLIADHLGWFKDSTDGGKLKTVEDLLASKGEKIKKGRMGEGGVIEFAG